ncbi:unnamed protein product [Clonostachys rosea]|uniref:Uncharacterized protein n=1 Tax=Bionectria ochroleuca TaxID=29856 RepID=A0ABY6V2B3_BIOOC|nr:unnamed protein product [Clonostachys rosea]
MSLSPKHQFMACAMFFAILSGAVGTPIGPMKGLLAFPALGLVANITIQLMEAREPFIRFARSIKPAIPNTRSDTQAAGAAGRPEPVQLEETDRAAIVFEQFATQHDPYGVPGHAMI